MKKFLLFLMTFIIIDGAAFSKTKFSQVKKALKEDKYGKAIPEQFHFLNAKHAVTNPVSVSDFSIVGEKSVRFELNDGECGYEPKWSDLKMIEKELNLYYKRYPSKAERWYQFYIFLPKDYNSVAPSKMSLIQWKRHKPSKVLVMFQHMHAGLTFNRNGDTFRDSYVLLKKNEELLGNWTQIIFNTNWHPDPDKGFMKVWIDGQLKIDFKGISNHPSKGKEQSLRYGLYNSSMSRYKNIFETNKMPQRIIFFDGVRSEKNVKNYLTNLNVKNSSLKV